MAMLLDFKKYGVLTIKASMHVHELVLKTINDMQPFDKDKEYVFVIGLTRAFTIKYFDLVSMGGLYGTVASPREVYRHAIVQAVAYIMIAHNHPSGNKNPSTQEIELTKVMFEAGKLLSIRMIDHIIVADDEWFSFGDEGLLW
jgi:DNA repair protein RadC